MYTGYLVAHRFDIVQMPFDFAAVPFAFVEPDIAGLVQNLRTHDAKMPIKGFPCDVLFLWLVFRIEVHQDLGIQENLSVAHWLRHG